MGGNLAVEILLGLIAAVVAFASYMQAIRANREQSASAEAQAKATTIAVDSEAYARAKDIYEGALNTLRAELLSTRSEIQELRESNDKLLREASDSRISNERLRAEIVLLRAELAKHTGQTVININGEKSV